MSIHKHRITIEINESMLGSYEDTHLAVAWHVAQANPAPHGDRTAGALVERIGREIVRRWLRGVEPQLWHHQGRDHYWQELSRLAKYQPGGPSGTPEFDAGVWVPRGDDQADAAGGAS